jgi:hypothetical protein
MALAEALALVAGAALVLLCATFMVAAFYDPKGALDWINMHVAMRAAFNKISLPQAVVGKMRALSLLDGIADAFVPSAWTSDYEQFVRGVGAKDAEIRVAARATSSTLDRSTCRPSLTHVG